MSSKNPATPDREMAGQDAQKSNRRPESGLKNSPSRSEEGGFTLDQWNDWHWHVRNQITSVEDLEKWINLTMEEKRAIQFSKGRFRFSITPYWASLMDPSDFFCPIRRQVVPMDDEFRTSSLFPETEPKDLSGAVGGRLTHYSPCRAALNVHKLCLTYCRFCPQKRASFFQDESVSAISTEEFNEVKTYLKGHPEIEQIVISGGEPLLLNDQFLLKILRGLKSVPTIKTLRLETRMISFLPQRINASLVDLLKEFQPLYLMLHVNHPLEITQEFSKACANLADSGIPLSYQTVLLHQINDHPDTLTNLFTTLFKLRVRPYRLVQCLPSQGVDRFRTSISSGLKSMEILRGRMAGLALPEYVADTAGGKIPLRYESILSRSKRHVLLKNHEGRVFVVPEKTFSFLT